MTIGSRYVLCGILRPTVLGHLLEVEQGEWWQLDIAGRTDAYAGRRILAEGIRTGTRRLMVERLTLDEEDRKTEAMSATVLAVMIEGLKRMWRWWP